MGQEQGLCWKCRMWVEEAVANGNIDLADMKDPRSHCHHEPKEKPKCVCFFGGEIIWRRKGDGVEVQTAKFCPECGRKL